MDDPSQYDVKQGIDNNRCMYNCMSRASRYVYIKYGGVTCATLVKLQNDIAVIERVAYCKRKLML